MLETRAEQVALVASLFPGVAPLLDADAFEAVDGTFVDEELRQRQSDIVLRTRLAGQDVYVYVLIEHQSTVDPMMAVRMLRYQSRIWDRYLAQHPGVSGLPPILPAVVYQGPRAWTAATDVRDLIQVDLTAIDPDDAAAVQEYLPTLRYRLDDLTTVDVDALRSRVGTPTLQLMLIMLTQASGSTNPDDLIDDNWHLWEAVAAGVNGQRHLATALTYIVNVSDARPDRLQTLAQRLGPVAQEALMTTADTYRAEGHARGRTQGRAEGQATMLLQLLALKFGPLDDAAENRVHAATTAQLQLWAERVLTATSLDDVLD